MVQTGRIITHTEDHIENGKISLPCLAFTWHESKPEIVNWRWNERDDGKREAFCNAFAHIIPHVDPILAYEAERTEGSNDNPAQSFAQQQTNSNGSRMKPDTNLIVYPV